MGFVKTEVPMTVNYAVIKEFVSLRQRGKSISKPFFSLCFWISSHIKQRKNASRNYKNLHKGFEIIDDNPKVMFTL